MTTKRNSTKQSATTNDTQQHVTLYRVRMAHHDPSEPVLLTATAIRESKLFLFFADAHFTGWSTRLDRSDVGRHAFLTPAEAWSHARAQLDAQRAKLQAELDQVNAAFARVVTEQIDERSGRSRGACVRCGENSVLTNNGRCNLCESIVARNARKQQPQMKEEQCCVCHFELDLQDAGLCKHCGHVYHAERDCSANMMQEEIEALDTCATCFNGGKR